MSTLDTILARHSYRGNYSSENVPREDLAIIMQAGLAAPSGCNQQTTSLIAVDDPEVLEKLRDVMRRPMGKGAPAAICVLTQRIKSYHGNCYAVQDYSAAIENMLLMIVELGYQSCWYEGYVTDESYIGRKMADILGVPEDYELVCYLPVGKAIDEVKGPAKRPFEERARFNGFKSKDLKKASA